MSLTRNVKVDTESQTAAMARAAQNEAAAKVVETAKGEAAAAERPT